MLPPPSHPPLSAHPHALPTISGYPGKPDRYASRFKGLLQKMKELNTPKEVYSRYPPFLETPFPCLPRPDVQTPSGVLYTETLNLELACLRCGVSPAAV
eukprot:609054-Rhodomonas_salina.2